MASEPVPGLGSVTNTGPLAPVTIPRRLPPLHQLCPYCAACPAIPCADEVQRYLLGYIHAGERDFDQLLLLSNLSDGLLDFAASFVGAEEGGSV